MTIKYEIIHDLDLSRIPKKTIRPVTCLPVGIDKSDFIDATPFGSAFRKFIDAKTGIEHDCEKYYREYLKSVE